MSTNKYTHRSVFLALFGIMITIAAILTYFALGKSLSFFYSPTDMINAKLQIGTNVRLGGLVVPGSVSRKNTTIKFQITDNKNTLNITYNGTLPNLFKEGQGIIAEGKIDNNNQILVSSILAKHDEVYMPLEVKKALEANKHWKTNYNNPVRT